MGQRMQGSVGYGAPARNWGNAGKYATNLSLFKSNYSRIVTPVWLAYQHNNRAQAGVWYESMNGLGKNSPDWRS